MQFQPLYYADRLHLINPGGDVGVVTLWSKPDAVLRVLTAAGVDLAPDSSRIAVIANLYGDGLPQMVRNLLWNPQIRHVLILGADLSGSGGEIEALLSRGVERIERFGREKFQILGTTRTLDADWPAEALVGRLQTARLTGKLGDPATGAAAAAFIRALPPQAPAPAESARIDAPLPQYAPSYYPSEPQSHAIAADTPLDAWEQVALRCLRFGVPQALGRNRKRLELQNLKVVIRAPVEDRPEDLAAYGWSLEKMRAYQQRILSAELPEGVSYTYGQRLRGWWRGEDGRVIDMIAAAGERLRAHPTSRHAYLSLWDPRCDLLADEGVSSPCLVTLFLRVFEDRLTLTATYRAHNVMSAWLENIYGLMAIQAHVAATAGDLPLGPITVISHSISINPEETEGIARAQGIAAAWTEARRGEDRLDRATGRRELREDPHGYFAFTIDPAAGEIVVEHKAAGERLTVYRGRTAQEIERQLVTDNAISLVSHALFVGRELARHEVLLAQALKPSGAPRG